MLSFVNERESNSSFIRHYLLECPMSDIRKSCSELFQWFMCALITKVKVVPLEEPQTQRFVTSLVALLDKAVIDLTRSSYEYFEVLCAYASLVIVLIFVQLIGLVIKLIN